MASRHAAPIDKLSKVSHIVILHSKFSSELTFENFFLTAIDKTTRHASPITVRWKFSKVGNRVVLHSKFSSKLTFENFCLLTLALDKPCRSLSGKNSQKSARCRIYYAEWLYSWLLRIMLSLLTATRKSQWQSIMQRTATHCNALEYTATTLQHTATHCSTLQHTATHCNALQRTKSAQWQVDILESQLAAGCAMQNDRNA